MELVDVFNKRREKLGYTRERGNLDKNEYSISVHVWLLEEDKLWIQQRSNEKKMFPGLWEQSGGGVMSGEISLEAVKRETKEELGLEKTVLPVSGIRNLTKKDMKLNDATPEIRVDPQTYDVTVDGELVTCEPASELPLAQRYFLF